MNPTYRPAVAEDPTLAQRIERGDPARRALRRLTGEDECDYCTPRLVPCGAGTDVMRWRPGDPTYRGTP